MDSADIIRENRRQAVLDSLAVADPEKAQAEFRQYLESSGGSLNEWDERFLAFIREHSTGTLLGGTAGDGVHFLFSPQARAGFWVITRPEMRGKGLFLESDIERLVALAQEKGLAVSS